MFPMSYHEGTLILWLQIYCTHLSFVKFEHSVCPQSLMATYKNIRYIYKFTRARDSQSPHACLRSFPTKTLSEPHSFYIIYRDIAGWHLMVGVDGALARHCWIANHGSLQPFLIASWTFTTWSQLEGSKTNKHAPAKSWLISLSASLCVSAGFIIFFCNMLFVPFSLPVEYCSWQHMHFPCWWTGNICFPTEPQTLQL